MFMFMFISWKQNALLGALLVAAWSLPAHSWTSPHRVVRTRSTHKLASVSESDSPHESSLFRDWNKQVLTVTAALTLLLPTSAAFAVSGGGLDYAGLDITGQDFSNGNYKGKDFTQVIAKTTKFANSNLQGCRFYKAFLAKADFTGADIRGASLEDTNMEDASLKDAIASGAYFSDSILETATVENADFTDAQFPVKTLPLLCDRPDVKGTNPKTGVDTRESLMCP